MTQVQHVPVAQVQPTYGQLTNVFGTENQTQGGNNETAVHETNQVGVGNTVYGSMMRNKVRRRRWKLNTPSSQMLVNILHERLKYGGKMTRFDASASALGFQHQIRWALYELLMDAKRTGNRTQRMTLEIYDDVAITDADGRPQKAIQLKQHRGAVPLTDASVDLWKTLRVWLETPSLADEHGPTLYLVTTAPIQDGSAAWFLQDDQRDVARALTILDSKAADLSALATKAGKEAWAAARTLTRTELLMRIRVIGQSPRIDDVDALLDVEFAATVRSHHLSDFRDRLWGWWDSRCIQMLLNNSNAATAVSAEELYARIQLIRDDFVQDVLPIDLHLSFRDNELDAERGTVFAKQLEWVGLSDSNLTRTITDYLRAYAHTTKWVQDGDLFDDDLQQYEKNLKTEWSNHFDDMLEDLESEGTLDANGRSAQGRELFRKLRDAVQVTVRPGFTDLFHARGTRCKIANDGEYGWHPDFRSKVQSLMTSAVE